MGCFGDMEATKQQTTTLPSWLTDAAQTNIGKATDVASRPFTPYQGEMVAPLTQNQQDAFGLIKSIAGSSNPYLSDIENLYKSFSTTPASSVSAPSILGGDKTVANTTISDYMSPYIMAALNPQLDDLARTGVAQRQALDASATMDGAFGDARSGVALANQYRDEARNRENIIGTGYNTAFNTAAGLRGQDITNSINTQTTNANLLETALQRAITGGKAFQDLDTSQVNRGLTTADALAKAGQTEQQTNQAKDTAAFQEFLRGQGWDQQQISWLTSVLAGTPHDTTTTVSQPNNSGWGIAGSLISMLPAIISDRRLKTDIAVIGATLDGLPIYRFKYVGSDQWQIGLMAQDVEEVNPSAVVEVNGVKAVNLELATQAAADMGADV
ncbi:tail fiber domain-containing protein [Bradyrhizobium sp. BRP22]|uniref:tail fiber domain-containing protein n=1 Tax=Bradyrhizobium sp. BRP22 TaxID=2793821 RepID=UPI001CD5F20E|nr:tail fiber domain-containing protein [Bradyrhizobium sp. BRP22]MCA1458104.1 tail fiber domain-containing protein [Bradyrhizobium sp. BRP22]